MKTQSWFQKETPSRTRAFARPPGVPSPVIDKPSLAARLRPHELIAMLTHHYSRVRARTLPRVTTKITVTNPSGKQAVSISFG
jgi:hypothetical protein